eukprot:scaffold246_cov414-Prasinococcus_capsulatus_cf.AAC.30
METECQDAHGCAVFCQMDGRKIDGSGSYGFSAAEAEMTLSVSEGLHTLKCFSADALENVAMTGLFQFRVDCTGPEIVFNPTPNHVDQNGTVYDSNGQEVVLMTKTYTTMTYTNYELRNELGVYANTYNSNESVAKTNSPEGSFEYICRHAWLPLPQHCGGKRSGAAVAVGRVGAPRKGERESAPEHFRSSCKATICVVARPSHCSSSCVAPMLHGRPPVPVAERPAAGSLLPGARPTFRMWKVLPPASSPSILPRRLHLQHLSSLAARTARVSVGVTERAGGGVTVTTTAT